MLDFGMPIIELEDGTFWNGFCKVEIEDKEKESIKKGMDMNDIPNHCCICGMLIADDYSTVCDYCRTMLDEIESKKNEIPNEKYIKDENPNVNPKHYDYGSFDACDVMLATLGKEKTLAFCEGTILTYILRHDMKNGDEDLKKAMNVLRKYFEIKETVKDS